MPGALFVVATPIGNLEDLTFRALRTLKEADVVAAEDTRRTSKLLAHYGISKPLVSLHEHNEHREAPRLVDRVASGESVALVSDAGTPAISDPGATLVRLCRAAGLRVVAIPGPSAVTAALSVTGVPATPFTFLGFPPASGQERTRWFDAVAEVPGVVVFFEAPHRITKTLKSLEGYAERPIFVHRELTKIHEELVKWDISDTPNLPPVLDRGEFVVVLGPSPLADSSELNESKLLELYEHLEALPSISDDQALTATAAALGLQKFRVRNIVKKAKILVKRQMGPSS